MPDSDAKAGTDLHSRMGEAEKIPDVLVALRAGAPDVRDRLVPLVYEKLRRIAPRQLRVERVGHTLSTTALVHEAYLRLVDQTRAEWTDRAQFFALAARLMRRILVDYARQHRALRRGGNQQHVALDDAGALAVAERAEELISLDEAMERLAALDDRLVRVIECRFFVGLTEPETAAALGVTARTVARDWVRAKGWLYEELRSNAR
jgi:RNA polymerase sigma factor (TIGR02999 family)